MKAIFLAITLALAAPVALAQSSGGGGGSSSGGGSSTMQGGGGTGSEGMIPRQSTPSERTATGSIANERVTDEGVPMDGLWGDEQTAGTMDGDTRRDRRSIGQGRAADAIEREAANDTLPGVRDSERLGEQPDGRAANSPVLGGPREDVSPLERPLDLPR
jgi:hypothetical protein